EGWIAAEELVAAVPAEHHGSGLLGCERERIAGEERGVTEGLVEELADPIHERQGVPGAEYDRLVLGAAVVGDPPGKRSLVVRRFRESDTEGPQGRRARARRAC